MSKINHWHPKLHIRIANNLAFVIAFTLLLSFTVLTSAQQSEWSKTYTDSYGRGNALLVTSDGGFVITGVSNRHFMLSKVGSSGELNWWKTYQSGEATSVIQTKDGGYAVVGSGEVNFMKTDSFGTVQWSKNFVNGSSTSFKINSVARTLDGGYILAGYTPSGNSPQWDLTMKVDLNGTIIWSKSFGTQRSMSFATNVLTIEDGYVLAANSRLYGLNLNGEIQWSEPSIVANCLIRTGNGGYLVVSSAGSVLTKTDSEGITLWSKVYKLGSPQKSHPEYRFLQSAVQTKDGGFIACGRAYPITEGVAWIVKIDSDGNELWNTTAAPFSGHNSYANSIVEVTDGVYVFTGAIESISNPRYSDVWLVKVSNSILPASNSIIPLVEDSSPTPTMTPTPIPTNSTLQPIATPTVPEFPSWTIPLLLTIIVALAGLLVYHKKPKQRSVK